MEIFMIKTGFYDKCGWKQSALAFNHSHLFFLAPQGELDSHLQTLTRGALDPRVTQIEAERLEETRDEREAFRKMLLEEVERQAREKNVHIKLPDGRQL